MRDFRPNGEILCMGSVNIDMVMVMHKLPNEGETIVTDNFSTYPGGKGGNQAVAAAQMGARTSMFTKLGTDELSGTLKKQLEEKGVKTDNIIIEEGTAGIAIIRVDLEGRNSISFTPGNNALLTPEDVEIHRNLFEPNKILLITMEISTPTVYKAVRAAHKNGMLVILDPSPVPTEPFPEDIPRCIDIVKPNQTEASWMVGRKIESADNAKEAVLDLRRMGFAFPVITLGEDGVISLAGGSPVLTPSHTVKAVDTTAAGDVFSGALAAAIAGAEQLETAIGFANAAAALSIMRKGAQTSIPSLDEVKDFLKGVT